MTDIYKAAGLCVLFVLFCAVGAVYSQDAQLSSINEIELRAQSRGIVLVITGSGPIAISGRADELEKLTSKYSEVRISIKNAVSNLGVKSFSGPSELPIREISLKEGAGSVDLTIKMRGIMNGPVKVRSGNNQIRILLTKDAYPQVSWVASTGAKTVAPAAAPAVEKKAVSPPSRPPAVQRAAAPALPANIMSVTIPSDKPRSLNNIRVLQRDKTVSLNFDFSDEPVVSVNKTGDSLVIRFSNTVSKISSRVYNVPGNTVYSSVRIRQERAADKSNNVVAVVRLNQKSGSVTPVGMRLDNKYVLYAENAGSSGVFLWSALEGVQSSVSFAQIEAEPIDMQKMESRAAGDIEKSGGALFPIADGADIEQAGSPKNIEAVLPVQPEQPVRIASPRSEVPEVSFANAFDDDDTAPDSEIVRESTDGDMVRYKVYGRDPFVPLMRDPGITGLPKVENLRLVGVLEDSRERIALLEDFTNENRAFAMRADDMVEYGKVLRIHRDRVVFLMSDFGVARSYTLRIARNAQ